MTSPPRKYDFLAAFLSYLIPGLGQVMQGRIGKGVLYFVCLYGLFFYGMWLGQFRNVWLAKTSNLPEVKLPVLNTSLSGLPKDLSYRKEFLAQFWIGAAAWPALLQYGNAPEFEAPGTIRDEQWDTERDEEASEAAGHEVRRPSRGHPLLGRYMRPSSEHSLNQLISTTDTTWDLGWVFTIIAGVLNVLVIYDALAGPLVREDQNPDGTPKTPTTPTTGGAK